MSDFDRLKAMLRRSARDGTAQAGRFQYATAAAGLARMLHLFDTAVVGQSLRFDFDDGSRLVCEASGRRLVRLLAPPPPGLPAEQVALFGRDALAVDAVGALSVLFRRLCERGSGFALSAEPLGEGGGPARGGIGPAVIAEAAGLPREALSETGDGMTHEALLAALQPLVHAAMLIEGEDATLVCGEGDEGALLVDWVENSLGKLLSPGFPLLGTLETHGILVFALPGKTGRHVLVAGRCGSFLVATIEGGDVGATADLWRRHWQDGRA